MLQLATSLDELAVPAAKSASFLRLKSRLKPGFAFVGPTVTNRFDVIDPPSCAASRAW